jgi:hypothetical protein
MELLSGILLFRPGPHGQANTNQRLMDLNQARNCSKWNMLSMMRLLLIVIYISEEVLPLRLLLYLYSTNNKEYLLYICGTWKDPHLLARSSSRRV